MRVTVTVVYPVTFSLEGVKRPKTEQELLDLRKLIKRQADEVYEASSISPVIHQCDEFPEIVE